MNTPLGQSHEQLAMFYTPPQIKERWGILPEDRDQVASDMRSNYDDAFESDYTGDRPPSDEEFWEHRRMDNDYRSPGFESDVRNEGVYIPVTLGRQFIQDGHHRIAAARDTQLIPAVHTEDSREVGRSSPTLFHADGYRFPSPNTSEDDWGDHEYDPENSQHLLVGGTAQYGPQ